MLSYEYTLLDWLECLRLLLHLFPVSMMHQQSAPPHYSSSHSGAQQYQGQQTMGMMGQANPGNNIMPQRPMGSYRTSQQGKWADVIIFCYCTQCSGLIWNGFTFKHALTFFVTFFLFSHFVMLQPHISMYFILMSKQKTDTKQRIMMK